MAKTQAAEIEGLKVEMGYTKSAIEKMENHTDAKFKELGDRIDTQSGQTNARLKAIEDVLREAKGGWKVLVVVGGIAATIGAFTSKLVAFLFSLPFPK